MNRIAQRRGFASLPVVLLLGGIIIEITIAGALIFYYINGNVFGNRLATQAAAAARAGVDDAFMRIIYNPSCGNDEANCPGTYTLTAGTAAAEVTICKDTCSGLPAGASHKITAIGTAQNKKHEIVAFINAIENLPLVTLVSMTDTPL
jgi:hypothetical protein